MSAPFLSQALAAAGLAPTGLRVRRDGGDTMVVRAAVSLAGGPARALKRVTARLSLEPGVRDLRRHLDDTSLAPERETAAA